MFRPTLTPEQQAEAQRIAAVLMEATREEIRAIAELLASKPDHKAFGRTYFTCGFVTLGLMVMSYFGRVAQRCSRVSYGFLSLAATPTPSAYSPWRHFTVG
jgi:hypothetical protein